MTKSQRISQRSDRSKIIKKIDKVVSYIIRTRDKWTCQRCLTKYEPPTQGLHCSHYFSRRFMGTRFDLENLISLCYGCHRLWEGDKQGAYKDLMIKRLGENEYNVLEFKARNVTKFSNSELEILLKSLKEQWHELSLPVAPVS